MSANRASLLGIDIGGTKTAFIVGTESGEVIARAEIGSDSGHGRDKMLDDIRLGALDMLGRYPDIQGCGVSVGGPVDAQKGLVLGPPHLPGWDRVDLPAELSALGRPVAVEHDAKAGALAEWKFGAGQGADNLVFLTLGTGIGAGIIADGRLLRGHVNAAGEIGHWRIAETGPELYGKPGSLEGYASGAGLAALARHDHPDDLGSVSSAKELAERARAGEVLAIRSIARSGEALGRAIAQLIDLLAPERVILGGLAERIGEPLLAPMRAAIAREALPALAQRCNVVLSQFGPAIGDVAALAVAANATR
ncbi:ROK family protein [Cucumibacter marinus]|uniref:ROK family protein n=1 Tax=Cucumibacter marinus TaxID=1121252 RepID=UPI000415653E|nr:ROK family protein [Cucumibacter marinus]